MAKRLHRGDVEEVEDPFENCDVEDPDDPDFVLPTLRPRQASLSSNATVCIEDEPSPNDGLMKTASHPSIQPSSSRCDRLDINESHQEQSCEVYGCNKEVFSACVRCLILQCWDHFVNDASCENHFPRAQSKSPSILTHTNSDLPGQLLLPENEVPNQILRPEDFEVEGAPKEVQIPKKKRINKKKQNKLLKDQGKEYLTQVKQIKVPARCIGPSCIVDNCQKKNRSCHTFTQDFRQNIFEEYWMQGNVDDQRAFLASHVERLPTQRKTAGPSSKRQVTFKYYLTKNGERLQAFSKYTGYYPTYS